MVDTKLVNKARKKSELLESVDSSWRTYVAKIKDKIIAMPFEGNYSALIEENFVFVEGYSGLLLIDKVYYSHKTFLLKSPVRYCPFKIYGVYNNRGQFENFVARPEIGFHYLGMSAQGHAICTGEINYQRPDSLQALREVSLKIANSFRLINMESLGTVLLPDSYARLSSIFSNKEEDVKTKFDKLFNEGLIEEIL